MKRTHIIVLALIAVAIGVLISFMGSVSTYETIASAKEKPGRYVNLIVKLDKSQPFEYDPIINPNLLKFTAIDTLGNTIPVVYHNAKPTDMEKSERLVLKGRVKDSQFECEDILLKCPSKYKDDVSANAQNVQQQMADSSSQSY